MKGKLLNIVIEYDRKQKGKRHYSPSALGRYCLAVDEVMKKIHAGAPVTEALMAGFCGLLLQHIAKELGIPPESFSKYQ